MHAISILQARGVGAIPEVALWAIDRFVAVTSVPAVELAYPVETAWGRGWCHRPLADTIPGAEKLLQALVGGRRPKHICGEQLEEGLQWLDGIAAVLDDVVQLAVPKFPGHGSFGIFDPKYHLSKVRLMYQTICRVKSTVRTVCELGFNAGHTSLIFLETLPHARVLSFDLGDIPWARWSAALLNATHGDRFEYIMGDSAKTVPAFKLANPDTECDLLLIDGGKDYALRKADLKNLRSLSKAGATLLFDEVCQEDCARGTNQSGICRTCWGGCSRAYADASRAGLIEIRECDVMESLKDGMCSAVYL